MRSSPTVPMTGLGISRPIDGPLAHDIVNAHSLAFFDRHLRMRHEALPGGLAKQYPGVHFESGLP